MGRDRTSASGLQASQSPVCLNLKAATKKTTVKTRTNGTATPRPVWKTGFTSVRSLLEDGSQSTNQRTFIIPLNQAMLSRPAGKGDCAFMEPHIHDLPDKSWNRAMPDHLVKESVKRAEKSTEIPDRSNMFTPCPRFAIKRIRALPSLTLCNRALLVDGCLTGVVLVCWVNMA